jgi:hypothetical protein
LQKTLFRSVLTVLIKVPNATLESHTITQDGARYFGLMSLRSPYGDYTDTVGLRNSHHKSFPIGLAFGSRVWLANRFLVGESFLHCTLSINGVRERITFLSLYLFAIMAVGAGLDVLLSIGGVREPVHVRYEGQPGRHLLALSCSQFDPLRTLWCSESVSTGSPAAHSGSPCSRRRTLKARTQHLQRCARSITLLTLT